MGKSRKIYTIKIAETPAKFIRKQKKNIQRQILKEIHTLAENPQEKGTLIKSTKGKEDLRKTRSGAYRIAYKIKERRILVLVVRVAHRKAFYKYYDRRR